MQLTATPKTYLAVFLVSTATLLLELLLTRIWSVTMWYHFAFVAVSLAMFGMTAGALIVYLLPRYFTEEKTIEHICLSSLIFGVSTELCFLAHLAMPFMPDKSLSGLFAMALSYLVIAVPFIFSGIAITLSLTRFPKFTNKLYASDLAGAALGCILFMMILNFTDGPTAVLLSGFFPAIAALLLSNNTKYKKISCWASCIIALLVLASGFTSHIQHPLVRLLWVKANFASKPFFEKWNSFSRVTIDGDEATRLAPSSWGLSKSFEGKRRLKETQLLVDDLYATAIPSFTGDYKDTEYFKYDISYLVHFLRPNSHVLVIGVGGGRDILAALSFDQKSVVGVEINNIFVDMLRKSFATYSGNFASDPRVKLVTDEARSFTARQTEKFDIIQLCFINTGTATGAGAFALTENSLYTQESWQMFLNHLTDKGVLTCTRNYFRDELGNPRPGELQRFVALARSALARNHITDTQNHIVCVSWLPPGEEGATIGAVTMLVSKQAFSPHDLEMLNALNTEKGYSFLLAPGYPSNPTLQAIASGKSLAELEQQYPTRLDAPTDDNPFFFYVLRFSQLFATEPDKIGTYQMYVKAMEILLELLVVVVMLTAVCLIVPLFLTNKLLKLRRDLPLIVFFASIGFAFMFIEVSQLQRLIVFLGHPSYSLSVVLFTLLLSSSLGSLSTTLIPNKNPNNAYLVLLLLILIAMLYGAVSPHVISAFQTANTFERIAITIAMLFPVGFFMGMSMPLGLQLAARQSAPITPWLWGINGATSVCASVATVAVSINWGLSASYTVGVLAYLVAFASYIYAAKYTNDG